MKLEFVFVGKTSEKYLAEGILDFHKRLKRYASVTIKTVKDIKSKASDSEILKLEGQGILKELSQGSFNVLLDPAGKSFSSEEFAQQISQWHLENRKTVTFVIGGSNGFSEDVYRVADFKLSLSRMTFTHEMARVLLFEQLYRAYSINAGSKYHK